MVALELEAASEFRNCTWCDTTYRLSVKERLCWLYHVLKLDLELSLASAAWLLVMVLDAADDCMCSRCEIMCCPMLPSGSPPPRPFPWWLGLGWGWLTSAIFTSPALSITPRGGLAEMHGTLMWSDSEKCSIRLVDSQEVSPWRGKEDYQIAW